MKIIGVYCIENIVNGKKYIGAAKDVKHRFSTHKSRLKKQTANRHIQQDYNIFGIENFIFYIIEECEIKDLRDKEIYYIKYYKTNDIEHGYNKTNGGESVLEYHHSQDIIEKISKSNSTRSQRPLEEAEKYHMAKTCQGIIKTKNKTSQYVGVNWDKKYNSYKSAIRANGKKNFLGYFDNEIDAAIAYNEAALRYYGNEAKLNIINERNS